MNYPSDIFNQVLDAIGSEVVIGDPQEGSRASSVILRAYSQCLRQVLRSAHWNFARKQAPMEMLADATGQTQAVGTNVPTPWVYEYALPTDCMQVRFVPSNPQCPGSQIPAGNIQPPNPDSPLLDGSGQPPLAGVRMTPARFLVATDFNNLPPQENPADYDTVGVAPGGRTVVLCNVLNAQLVYTALVQYPSLWDPLFRSAFVAYLAAEVALPLTQDKKFGRELRGDQMKIATQKVMQARVRDGNEGSYNSDIAVDWINRRGSGSGRGWGGDEGFGGIPGQLWQGWDSGVFTGNTGAY